MVSPHLERNSAAFQQLLPCDEGPVNHVGFLLPDSPLPICLKKVCEKCRRKVVLPPLCSSGEALFSQPCRWHMLELWMACQGWGALKPAQRQRDILTSWTTLGTPVTTLRVDWVWPWLPVLPLVSSWWARQSGQNRDELPIKVSEAEETLQLFPHPRASHS